MNNRKKLLFVCVENSCRSQMAEAIARMDHGDSVDAFSAGSKPSGRVNPKAVATMRELGYDMAPHWSKSFEDVPSVEYDAVVTMGCGDSCRHIPANRRDDWAIPDPKHLEPDEFRTIRDEIGRRVGELVSFL